MASKKTKGRQKIEMKEIAKEDDKLITFSKRRSGIYKKASELVTLTGAEVAFVVFSPTGKPFSFGHPSIESISNRLLGRNPNPTDNTHPVLEAHRRMRIEEFNQLHNEVLRQLELEKAKGKELKVRLTGKETSGWWDAPIEELDVQQLLQMDASFKDLHNNLLNKIKQLSTNAPSSSHHLVNINQMPYSFSPNLTQLPDPSVRPPGFHY
ncbi:hypothetical protein K2173_006619 [Erythroxylum novogranatense]|uniref:MADS-box domain-containing protein n=1 Tax=Erythroxylum novogranatense TaxID=1862640 RepID=A0AAV8T5P3_9ROSI|nr:hypothetical protein K2173_006619 [Erythroxylum novogranatense]